MSYFQIFGCHFKTVYATNLTVYEKRKFALPRHSVTCNTTYYIILTYVILRNTYILVRYNQSMSAKSLKLVGTCQES